MVKRSSDVQLTNIDWNMFTWQETQLLQFTYSSLLNSDDDEVIRNFVADHNMAFNITDHFTKLTTQVPTALKFHYDRAKTTQTSRLSPV